MSEQQQERIPDNHVVAVISGTAASEEVQQDLEREGFGQAVLFRGDEVAERVDPKGEHSGPFTKIIRAIQDHFSEQTNYLTQYQEEARSGNVVIAVPVDDRDQAEAVRTIVERNGARNVRYFGKLAVTDLTPDTNPSARSAESPEVQASEKQS